MFQVVVMVAFIPIVLFFGSIAMDQPSIRRRLGYVPPVTGEGTDYHDLIKAMPGISSIELPSQISYILPLNNLSQTNPEIFADIRDSQPFHNNLLKGTNRKPHSKETQHDELSGMDDRRLQDVFDIVLLTSCSEASAQWLAFLDSWKTLIQYFHLIIIQRGTSQCKISIPDWCNYELYTKADIDAALGRFAWIIDAADDNSTSVKTFGYMVADREYVFFLDRDTEPAFDNAGIIINPFEEHLANLHNPSTPYYMNTLKDPYRVRNDFARGYPYSLRSGIPTAISHGHVRGAGLSHDALTREGHRLAPPPSHAEHSAFSNEDVATTVPHGSLFSMNMMNVAVNKRVAGPVMFSPGILRQKGYNVGNRYDDIIMGWICKVVLDHIRAGVKHGGRGYVAVRVDQLKRAESPQGALQEIGEDLLWNQDAEAIMRFFSNVALTKNFQDSSSHALLELADLMSDSPICKTNKAFADLSNALKAYSEVWTRMHRFHPEILPVASRSSFAPPADSPHKCAVMTIMHDEPTMLPIWLRYYSKHFPHALFVGEHMMNTSRFSPQHMLETKETRNMTQHTQGTRVTHWQVFGDQYGFPVHFLVKTAEIFQQRLLRAGYTCTMYTDVDEMLAPDPVMYPGGLTQYLTSFSHDSKQTFVRANGHNIAHVSESENAAKPLEPNPINWSLPLLSQRSYWTANPRYNKPLLSKVPMRWRPGFHVSFVPPSIPFDPNLYLLHLTDIDKETCLKREERKYKLFLNGHQWENGGGFSSHLSKFPSLMQHNQVCKTARSAYFESKKQVMDYSSSNAMSRMCDSWQNVTI